MLADLDRLMRARGIDVIVVPMHEAMHPSFRWLARGAKVTRGYAIKPAGRQPLLVTYPMEREEAAATGLEVHLVHEYDHEQIFRTAANTADGYAEFFARVLGRDSSVPRGSSVPRDSSVPRGSSEFLGEIHPRSSEEPRNPEEPSVAFFGNAPLQLYMSIAEAMERRGWRVHRANGEDLIQLARKRKEEEEIEAIRSVGERTEQVVDGVRALLREARPGLKLGDLKSFVSSEIARLGMYEDHETILSQGRDAGVPHSRGDANALVRPSLPIVLDIFPADKTSGYFFDLSRTFCIGPIPDELQRMHALVFEAFSRARDAMRPGTLASSYQALVCDFFEKKGYPTLRSHPTTHEGYVHGLGHGVGLEIHEKPSFALNPNNLDAVEVGDILTIEPGLYFPERELGVRIEDTFVVREEGVETLCRGGYGLRP